MKKITITFTMVAALAAAPAAFAQSTPVQGASGGQPAAGAASGGMQASGGVSTPIQTTKAPVGTTTITQADVTPVPPPTTTSRERDTVTLKQSFRPNRPLLYTGSALFLGSYVTTAALTATKVNDDNDRGDRTMYIPVVGPWMHLADIKETGTDLALTIGSGVLQGAGIGLAAASLFIPEKVPAATIQAGNVKMNVAPTTFAGGGGMGAVGQF